MRDTANRNRHQLARHLAADGASRALDRPPVNAAPPIRTQLAPLRVPAFGRLLFSYTTNSIGDYVGLVALAVLVYGETRDPLATTALFIAAQFLPAFIAPALTAHVDQLALRRVLPTIYVGEALVFALLALLADEFLARRRCSLLALVDGVLMLTARGLSRGAVNAILQPVGVLREGNGLLNIGFAIASVGGSALGGLLVAWFSVAAALAVNAASFAVIAVVLATSRHLPAAQTEREPFRERIREGLRYARTDRIARLLLGGEAIAIVFFTLIVPIEIVYARETLDTDEAGYGILLSSWGAGIVLGQPALPGRAQALDGGADPALDARDRRRLPRHGGLDASSGRRARSPSSAASATASSGCR